MILSILVSLFTLLVTPVDTSIHATVEAQAIVSDAGVTPFWMRSLQYGSVPMENPGLILRAWNGKTYNLKKKYDWKYEVEATGWTGIQNNFWLTQAYVSGRRGKWELWAGRRKEVYGLGDTTMTGGFYAWSGNAMPMPKIQFGTRDYLNFAKGWLGIHMTYSHGWFDNQGPTINAYLHQKSLYGRIGKPESKINLFGGINHQVYWGGEAKEKSGQFDIYPSSLNAYFYVVTALKNRTIIPEDKNTSWFDALNQYGNHLGSIDLALQLKPFWGNILIYKQTSYETGRVASLTTANDGIWGATVQLKKHGFFEQITMEYLSTANQGLYVAGIAKFLGLVDTHYPETESYFNNGASGGWAYWRKGIGTPLLVIDHETRQGGGYSFRYNAVKSIYIALRGQLPANIKWLFRISKSQNGFIQYGSNTPDSRFIAYTPQLSSSLRLEKELFDRIFVQGTIGIDRGEHIANSLGGQLTCRYLFF
jgi:hypothetical protein